MGEHARRYDHAARALNDAGYLVRAGLSLLTPLTDRYQAAGLTDVTVRVYPGARHEIVNETNRVEVLAALNSWLDRVVTNQK
jgi:alpha-beta hydrolase superfamily lysophospholipase